MKIVKKFQPKIVIFTALKYRCLWHGLVPNQVADSGYATCPNFSIKGVCWI